MTRHPMNVSGISDPMNTQKVGIMEECISRFTTDLERLGAAVTGDGGVVADSRRSDRRTRVGLLWVA